MREQVPAELQVDDLRASFPYALVAPLVVVCMGDARAVKDGVLQFGQIGLLAADLLEADLLGKLAGEPDLDAVSRDLGRVLFLQGCDEAPGRLSCPGGANKRGGGGRFGFAFARKRACQPVSDARLLRRERLTGEVSLSLVRAIVFAPGCVVPFYSNPVSRGAGNLTNIPRGAYGAIVGQPVAYLCLRCHTFNRR